MLTLAGYFRFYQCKEQRGDGKMKVLECERIESDLYPSDSQSTEALMSEVDEYLSQQSRQALDKITSRLEQVLEEVVERNFTTPSKA